MYDLIGAVAQQADTGIYEMRMKYIIMCGGHYNEWETPRQMLKVKGEEITARTIRLLRENGVEDIAISTDNPAFEKYGLPILKHDNTYHARKRNDVDGYWCDAFYPTDDPACYIFGDVIFSPEAVRTIVETDTDDIELFGSAQPFAPEYPKKWVEPFAFKVRAQARFRNCITEMKRRDKDCWRSPIAWDLWALIRGRRTDIDDYRIDYTVINDYTCDIDHKNEIPELESRIKE